MLLNTYNLYGLVSHNVGKVHYWGCSKREFRLWSGWIRILTLIPEWLLSESLYVLIVSDISFHYRYNLTGGLSYSLLDRSSFYWHPGQLQDVRLSRMCVIYHYFNLIRAQSLTNDTCITPCACKYMLSILLDTLLDLVHLVWCVSLTVQPI